MRKSRHHIFVSSLASGVYIIPRVRTAQSSDLLASSFFFVRRCAFKKEPEQCVSCASQHGVILPLFVKHKPFHGNLWYLVEMHDPKQLSNGWCDILV